MRQSFLVPVNRYNELKQFIRTELLSCRFDYNPYQIINSGMDQVSNGLKLYYMNNNGSFLGRNHTEESKKKIGMELVGFII
jgi:hypothetical protein